MVCKKISCSEFLDIPDKAGRKKEEKEQRQSQSVLRFKQTQ